MKNKIPVLISLLILLLANTSQGATAINPSQNNLHLISSSEKGISFEVQVPWQILDLQELNIEGSTYTKVNLSDWDAFGQAGSPELPVMTTTFAVPFGVEISLEIYPGEAHTKKLEQPILPVADQLWEEPELGDYVRSSLSPTQKLIYEMDKTIYTADAAFPGVLAEITNDGILRQQRLIGLSIYPVQYHPGKSQLLFYESIRVDINFKGTIPLSANRSIQDSELFESLYEKTIVNYESAASWRNPVSISMPEVERDLVNRQTPWLPPSPGWRVSVIEEGFYKLTYTELAAKNLPVDSLSLSTLQIFNMGSEIAIQVVDNNSNDHFDPDDFILFYAEALDNKYSAENIYWLTYGQGLGLRMQSRDVSPDLVPPSPIIPGDFPSNLHFERNLEYATSLPGPDELDRFVWSYISTPYVKQLSIPFELPAKTAGALETLKLTLVGYSQNPLIPLEHRAVISINGVVVGDTSWDDREWNIIDVALPTGLLIEGINTLTISSPSTHNDAFYIDWFEIGIKQHFIAQSNKLDFAYNVSGVWQFAISNFTSAELAAFEINDAAHPVWLSGLDINEVSYEVKFDDEISTETKYWITSPANYLSPEKITQDTPSQLWMSENQADYLLITHELFAGELQELMSLRAAQGLQVLKIDVQDIYDEFNFGITSAKAIRDFLAYTWNYWTRVPSIVILVGDGHYNPKNYDPGSDIWNNYGFGRISYIPPYLAMADSNIGETAADNKYVTIAGSDNLPDMILGRLAVNSVVEVQAFVNKILAYETSPAAGNWNMGITLVADNPDTAGSFQFSSEMLRSCCVPDFYTQERIYLGTTHSTAELAKAALITSINNGKLLVNFIGHGAYSEWAGYDSNPALSGDLLNSTDVANLVNQDKYAIVLAMTCAEGMYHHPHPIGSFFESMAEVITKIESKGAVASWSPTGWGLATGHDQLNRGFFTAALMNNVETIGQATLSGIMSLWSSGNYLDLIDTYLLFGDPALLFSPRFIALDDGYQDQEDQVLIVSTGEGVLSNDLHPQQVALSAVLVDDVTHGVLALDQDGSFTYTPEADYFGTDSFTYKANDGVQDSNIATVSIIVTPVNDPPVAYNQSVSTVVNVPVGITLVATDDEGGGISSSIQLTKVLIERSLTYNIKDPGPASGSLVFTAPDTVLYTPNQDFTGEDSFIFYVNDGEYNSNEATVSITISETINLYLPLILK